VVETVQQVALAITALAGLVLLVAGAVSRQPLQWHLWVVGVVEVALLVLAVVAGLALAQGGQIQGSTGVFLAYLVGTLLALPVAVLWVLGEPSRWSTVALGVVCLVIAVLLLRLDQIWTGAA
jgi:hypothetical protein